MARLKNGCSASSGRGVTRTPASALGAAQRVRAMTPPSPGVNAPGPLCTPAEDRCVVDMHPGWPKRWRGPPVQRKVPFRYVEERIHCSSVMSTSSTVRPAPVVHGDVEPAVTLDGGVEEVAHFDSLVTSQGNRTRRRRKRSELFDRLASRRACASETTDRCPLFDTASAVAEPMPVPAAAVTITTLPSSSRVPPGGRARRRRETVTERHGWPTFTPTTRRRPRPWVGGRPRDTLAMMLRWIWLEPRRCSARENKKVRCRARDRSRDPRAPSPPRGRVHGELAEPLVPAPQNSLPIDASGGATGPSNPRGCAGCCTA